MKSINPRSEKSVVDRRHQQPELLSVRLDQWLWASRFYKSRKLASEAIKGGHVWVNGVRAKPAKNVHRNDQLRIRRSFEEFIVDVLDLSTKRLSAPLAQALYEETGQSQQNRLEKLALQKSMNMGIKHARKKPSGRDRREMLKIKQQRPSLD